ncbi:glycoside hydrolase family 3 C-terminal domain-containing protein [Microbacterium sp. cx-55]|nr:glycoside hydrolase family 3 C-terminal domain-containing protein [Microbacterium sp. cx-55]
MQTGGRIVVRPSWTTFYSSPFKKLVRNQQLTSDHNLRDYTSVDRSKQLTLDSPEIVDRLRKLTLEQKVRLLTGANVWETWAEESIGLRPIVFSDGPSGVRGGAWDERQPSINLPSGTALAASWDVEIARLYGTVMALEARKKGVDVVNGPMINVHRSPLGGRSFESFSEDPRLTAAMAAGYVRGLQEMGVAANLKHYVANDYETDRYTANSQVEDRALHEIYLAAFEEPVREAGAWAVMSAYNAVNGVSATESPLLTDPLKTEWEFDGVVVSDWTAVRTLASAAAGQDLAMPGPGGPWGDALVDAVRSGQIPESTIDDKVRRILLLAARVGALTDLPQNSAPKDIDGLAVAKLAAAEGAVLLKNNGALPLVPADIGRVAVIGQHALTPRTQGGGSATVIPTHVTSPLDAIRAALPGQNVTHAIGSIVQTGIAPIPLTQIVNPSTQQPGALVRFLDDAGAELYREDRLATTLVYITGDAPIRTAALMEVTFSYTADFDGDHRIGFAAVGSGKIFADGTLVGSGTGVPIVHDLGANLNQPPPITAPLQLRTGESVGIRIEFDMTTRVVFEGHEGMFGIFIGTDVGEYDSEALLADAVAEASAADVAIVVVGTTAELESEGFDRENFRLPGNQDELVAAVAATGTPTLVVLNVGAPVLTPWRDQVAAVLVTYFGGEQMAEALADMLIGVAEPGGRLTTTWPRTGDEAFLPSNTPVDGDVVYGEGIGVGYREWLSQDAEPAYSFGHGLGYSSWKIDNVDISPGAEDVSLTVTVTNVGERSAKEVVQVYLSKEDSSIHRPVLWLAAWGVARCEPGASTSVEIRVPRRSFEVWLNGQWFEEAGTYGVRVGTSILDLTMEAQILRG